MKTRRVTILTTLLSAMLWTGVAMGDVLDLDSSAKEHFKAGIAYADDPSGPKWEEALKEFRAAYATTPTHKLMNNIGLCALNLERDGEAIEAFEAYLAGGGEKDLKPKHKKQIETDIATLKASLVKISLEAVPDELTLIDKRENAKGQLVINLYKVSGGKASLGLHPGRHKITAEAPGYTSAEWIVNADPSSSHQHKFELVAEKKAEAAPAAAAAAAPTTEPTRTAEPPKGAKRKTPTGVYIGLAATGVFAAAATTTGIITMGKSKDLDKITKGAEADDAKGTVKTWALITDIGIGAAVVSAGVTAYLFFTAPKGNVEKSATATSTPRQIQFAPFVTPNVAGGAVFGSF